jgi:predicted Zn finger-like uncharacterized protein
MNYITSCPACDTQFLLTKEHLKAYKGKVQCGNCEHIFNAKNRLTEISDDIQSTAEYQASISEQEKPANTETTAEEKPIDAVLSNVLEGVPSLQDLTSAPVEAEVSASDQFAYFDEPKIKATPEVPETIAVYDADQINTPIVIEDLTTDVRFSKPKIKINYWLVLAGILLAILAGLQTIYANRTQIAADYPQFKPMLVQACAALQCEISLPKNVDLLTIDDSDMQEDEDHENVIKFSSLLINNASYAQAYPDIELTLTATDDQPVLRRLIKPSEYLKSNSNAASGLAAREEIRVSLAINVKDLAVAGYRVLLVY